MVDMAAILNIVATVVSFVEGVVKNVSPLVSKYLDGKTHGQCRRDEEEEEMEMMRLTWLAPTTTTTPNPLCQLPRCNCSEDQLSSVCLQRRMSATSKNDDLPPISSSMPNESEATSS